MVQNNQYSCTFTLNLNIKSFNKWKLFFNLNISYNVTYRVLFCSVVVQMCPSPSSFYFPLNISSFFISLITAADSSFIKINVIIIIKHDDCAQDVLLKKNKI